MWKYAEKHTNKKTVILGDMNVHSAKSSVYYDVFHQIRTDIAEGGLGYADLVPDDVETFFPGHTTIDHVLVSPELKDKADAKVYSKKELCLSDHAVIVVDILM